MFVEIMAFWLKMFASHYCVDVFHIFSIIIQSYLKVCFRLYYILFITSDTLHQEYNLVDVVKYLIYFLVFGLLKVVVFCTFFQQSELKFVWHEDHLPGDHLFTTFFKKT